MERKILEQIRKVIFVICFCLILVLCSNFYGCSGIAGYSNESLYPDDVCSVYVEMFDNQSFRRGVEYELTDALAKRIESETPYKIVSDRNKADTIISGKILSVAESSLTVERETGRSLEKDVELSAVVKWKNLKTGQFIMNGEIFNVSASYSEWQNQGFAYASTLAANKLAIKIVNAMEKPW